MYLMMISMMLISILSFIIVMLINLISKKMISELQKSTPFECGFNPLTMKRLPFSIHFFLIAIIFLIFDIEIIIILPTTLTLKTSTIYYWIITSSTFVIILILGLYHEWKYGMLNWT
uniref:NADH dehydrogenase subunit 3 n=1 Tax=Limassolla dispunctata TaxID=3019670 RepID=UPI00300144EE